LERVRFNNNDDGVGGDEFFGPIFVYMGGGQSVPRDVKRVRIAENVDTILAETFQGCEELIEVEGHKRLRKIEQWAFNRCRRLRRVTEMTGVIEIEDYAFSGCYALSEIEFDRLEIIVAGAFYLCKSLRSISMPCVRRVGAYAFDKCDLLTDVVFGLDLERIEEYAFHASSLRRIVIPLKDNLDIDYTAFGGCNDLSNVDNLDGGLHKTISSLHMKSWRDEMEEEIDRINQTLPNTQAKTQAILEWIEVVHSRMEHYQTEHQILLKEAMTLLELALWKAKLLNEAYERKCNVEEATKKAKIDTEAARKEHRVTCGASIVIKNVLPFLALN
jgi:hypothetical protein